MRQLSFSLYFGKLVGETRDGKIDANSGYTEFQLWDGGAKPNEPGKQREQLCQISYEKQRSKSKPRAVRATFQTNDGGRDRQELINMEPRLVYNPEKRKREHQLSYHGRAMVMSVKNFRLCYEIPGSNHDEKEQIALFSFGKFSEMDIFTCDFRYPLSPLQAFAVALTAFRP